MGAMTAKIVHLGNAKIEMKAMGKWPFRLPAISRMTELDLWVIDARKDQKASLKQMAKAVALYKSGTLSMGDEYSLFISLDFSAINKKDISEKELALVEEAGGYKTHLKRCYNPKSWIVK